LESTGLFAVGQLLAILWNLIDLQTFFFSLSASSRDLSLFYAGELCFSKLRVSSEQDPSQVKIPDVKINELQLKKSLIQLV